MIRTRLSLLPLILSALFCSCAVGPDYVRPIAPVPLKYSEAPKGWKIATPQDCIDRGKWWLIFKEPLLNQYEDQLNFTNQNIINAIANYENAKALVDEARANFYPTVAGALGWTRQKFAGSSLSNSANNIASNTLSSSTLTGTTFSGGTAGATSGSRIVNFFSVFLNASWELDIWGAIRRQVEASVDTAQSSAALVGATRLSAQASLAQYYFELRALDTDQKLLDDTVKNYTQALQVTKNRYVAGVSSRVDVAQADAQLETAKAQSITNSITRSQYEHAIAVLIGELPENFHMPAKPLYTSAPMVPLEIPSAILERRPDVAQAERAVAAANAQIGVAISAFYPTLTLNGAASENNPSFTKLFSLPGLSWSVGPQLSDTLFDGGFRSAAVQAARATYIANVATYRQTVLTAFQNVEDNLVALNLLKQEEVVQMKAAASSKLAAKLIMNQYKAGTAAYTDVIVAQITAFNAQKAAYDVLGLEMVAAVGLIKALGGGWDDALIKNVPSDLDPL